MIEMTFEEYEKLVKVMNAGINTFVNHQKEYDQYDQRSKDIRLGMESMKMMVMDNIRFGGKNNA